MFVGTHLFLPVLATSAIDALRIRRGQKSLFRPRELMFIGLAGILPDLLSPHISLAARLTSWTHNVWFLVCIAPILLLFAKIVSKQKTFLLGMFLWLAVALHLIVDMSSGGISPIYPFVAVIRFRTIPFQYWLHADLVVASAALISALAVRRAEQN